MNILNLPNELLGTIVSFCDASTLVDLGSTCRNLNFICNEIAQARLPRYCNSEGHCASRLLKKLTLAYEAHKDSDPLPEAAKPFYFEHLLSQSPVTKQHVIKALTLDAPHEVISSLVKSLSTVDFEIYHHALEFGSRHLNQTGLNVLLEIHDACIKSQEDVNILQELVMNYPPLCLLEADYTCVKEFYSSLRSEVPSMDLLGDAIISQRSPELIDRWIFEGDLIPDASCFAAALIRYPSILPLLYMRGAELSNKILSLLIQAQDEPAIRRLLAEGYRPSEAIVQDIKDHRFCSDELIPFAKNKFIN